MTKSYNDPVKQKAREKLKDFISNHLLVHKNPEQIRVVCFPGAEQEGEEALEVKEVYDPLGIPRQNIIGLEINEKKARKLKKTNLGIEVLCEDALDFFRTTDRTFDVISLDYTGHQTWRERDTLKYIIGDRKVSERGVISTVHFIKREGMPMKLSLLRNTLFSFGYDDILSKVDKDLGKEGILAAMDAHDKDRRELYREIERRMKEGEKIDLDRLRDEISLINISTITGGIIETHPERHFFVKSPGVVEDFRANMVSPTFISKPNGIEKDPAYSIHKLTFRDAFHYTIGLLPTSSQCISLEQGGKIAQMLVGYEHKVLPLAGVERYQYTSNRGSNMLMDLFSLKPLNYRLVQRAQDLVLLDPVNRKVVPNPHRFNREKFSRKLDDFIKLFDQENFFDHLDSPVNLGSSYKPKERVSKDEAIVLLRSGHSPREIRELYNGLSISQLAALKARYVTIGKFGKAPDQK